MSSSTYSTPDDPAQPQPPWQASLVSIDRRRRPSTAGASTSGAGEGSPEPIVQPEDLVEPSDDDGEPDWTAEPEWDLLNFTQIPDRLFDRYLAYMSGSEVKVFLYLARHTWGWKRPADAISLNQMINGVRRKDGSRQDHGVGLSRSALATALAGLEAKRRIERRKQHAPDGGNEPTLYVLRRAADP